MGEIPYTFRPFREGHQKVLPDHFEAIKNVTAQGAEWWSARDLQIPLGYANWQNFANVIRKAIAACEGSGMPVADHFIDISKMILAGKGAKRTGPIAKWEGKSGKP